jgi:hypothetical protein
MLSYKELNKVGIWINNLKVDSYGVYIGRGSVLGNPFIIGKDGNREEVIEKYRKYLWVEMVKRDTIWNELIRLYGIWKEKGHLSLGCYCFPKACHGQVIGSALVWLKSHSS